MVYEADAIAARRDPSQDRRLSHGSKPRLGGRTWMRASETRA